MASSSSLAAPLAWASAMKTRWVLSTFRRDCQARIADARPAVPTVRGSHEEPAHRMFTAEKPPGSGGRRGAGCLATMVRVLPLEVYGVTSGPSSEADRDRGPDPAATDGPQAHPDSVAGGHRAPALAGSREGANQGP